jgi:hypothetical protein
MLQQLLHLTRGNRFKTRTSHDWLQMTDLISSTRGAPLFWPPIELLMTELLETGR